MWSWERGLRRSAFLAEAFPRGDEVAGSDSAMDSMRQASEGGARARRSWQVVDGLVKVQQKGKGKLRGGRWAGRPARPAVAETQGWGGAG